MRDVRFVMQHTNDRLRMGRGGAEWGGEEGVQWVTQSGVGGGCEVGYEEGERGGWGLGPESVVEGHPSTPLRYSQQVHHPSSHLLKHNVDGDDHDALPSGCGHITI